MSLALKRIIGRVTAMAPRPAPRRVVLLYHSVGDTPWGMSSAQFRAQVLWLSKNASLRTVHELLTEDAGPPLQVAITFDDGYASLRDEALPLLNEVCARPCVYLNTGWVLDSIRRPSDPSQGHYPEEQFLSWSDVEDLAMQGWAVGSHGVDHLDLTAAPERTVRDQLAESKERIEAKLGIPCDGFAYTWGRSNIGLRRMAAETGYRHAMGGQHGPLTEASDRMALPRINVANEYTLDDFKAVVRGDWDYLGAIQSFRARGR